MDRIRRLSAALIWGALTGVSVGQVGCSRGGEKAVGSDPSPGGPTGTGGAFSASRRTAWNPGLNAVGGIPSRSTICRTISPTGGDDTPVIQAALDGCPPNQVVKLTAGTFKINGNGLSLTTSYVTLRGSGMSTRLVKADRGSDPNHAIIYFGGDAGAFASSVDLATNAVKGTRAVTLAGNPGLTAGEFVLIDQVTTSFPLTFWGSVHDGPGGGSRRWFCRQDRSWSQIMEVESVSGNAVTFVTPFHGDFSTGYSAQLSRYGAWPGGPVRPFIKWSGIEDLYLYGGMGGDYHGNISMNTCAYCWVKNIESDYSIGTAVGLYGTYRCEVRDSYIHSSADPNPGGGGYLTGMHYGAADNLLENNIIWNGNKMIVMRATGGGNVIAYNYMDDGYGSYYRDTVEVGLNSGHYTTPHMELLEGNQAFNCDGDSYWGNSIQITLLRNHLTALRRSIGNLGLADHNNRRAASLNHHQYDYNFLGNVLGTPGQTLVGSQNQWVYEVAEGQQDNDSIVPMWKLGYYGEDPGHSLDPQVKATAIRHGNFDYVTNTVVWDPANADHELPASLYLAAKPAFFGSLPWPWVDPTGATKTHTLPARARFDAGSHVARAPVFEADPGLP